MPAFVKRRDPPQPGSIPAALDQFAAEVHFYRAIAPEVGVRVPACYRSESDDSGTLLELEDLSAWSIGADPEAAARLLSELHTRWEGEAPQRWPWLRPVGAAVDLVEMLFDRTWPEIAVRADCTPAVRALGERLVGRVAEAEWATASAGPLTLTHGDASMPNMRTSPRGEIALLDWEDVSAAPGTCDLAWLLVSSVEPERWGDVVTAYGASAGLSKALPAAAVQGLLSMADAPVGSADALAWVDRLEVAQRWLTNS